MSVLSDHVFLEYIPPGSNRSGVRIDFSDHREQILKRRRITENKLARIFVIYFLSLKIRRRPFHARIKSITK